MFHPESSIYVGPAAASQILNDFSTEENDLSNPDLEEIDKNLTKSFDKRDPALANRAQARTCQNQVFGGPGAFARKCC